MIAAPVLALSTLNCTLVTPTLSVAFADAVVTPEIVAFVAGAVTETVGGVVSPAVANVMSGLEALALAASVDRTRKWYSVPALSPVTATWWLVTIEVFVVVLDPYVAVVP